MIAIVWSSTGDHETPSGTTENDAKYREIFHFEDTPPRAKTKKTKQTNKQTTEVYATPALKSTAMVAVTVTLATSLTWVSAVLLPLLVLLALVVWLRGAGARHRLRRCGEQIPGPRPLPFIGNLLDIGLDPKKILEKMIIVNEKYGNTFRLWAGPFQLCVSLGDPSDIEALLSKSKNLKKAFNYDFLHRWLGLGLLTATGERWKKHRKIITPTFHFSILEQFVDVFNKQGNILMSILKKKEGEGPFDITTHIDLYTQDVICETAMGVKLNAQTEGYASSYIQSVKSMCELLMKRSAKPWLYLDFIYRLTHYGWQETNYLNVLHGMTNEVIRRRRKQLEEDPTLFENNIDEIGRKRKLAFLDLLLCSSLTGDVLSDEDIREEVDTFMFEGHDTTASAISFALYELSRRPDIQERILDELREVVPDDKLEELSLNIEDLNKLKYLEQVIKETLRLYPSVPVFGRQTTEDLHLPSISVDVPPNTTVVVIPALLHRNPQLYPNPKNSIRIISRWKLFPRGTLMPMCPSALDPETA